MSGPFYRKIGSIYLQHRELLAVRAAFCTSEWIRSHKLNRAIYDKLFRTPASDPWLGLAPADAFVALQNGGVQRGSVQPR